MVNITNPGASAATVRLDFVLSASAKRYSNVGSWVYDAPNDATASTYTPISSPSGQKGVVACSASACERYEFVGVVQPDLVSF